MTADGRDWLAALALPETARQQITVALAMSDALERSSRRETASCAPTRAGRPAAGADRARTRDRPAVRGHDPRRARRLPAVENSRDAVRYGGMDITVYQSDRHRSPGHLSRQGPPALRWALYEAAQAARRPGSPDRDYYEQAAERLGGNRACLALARKLLKRCYHTLRELGDDALAPPVEKRRGSGAARRASSGSARKTERPATNERADALAA